MAHHTGRLTVPEEVRTTWGECRWARVIAYAVVSRHGPSCSWTHRPGRGESRLRRVPMGKGEKPMWLSAGMAHHAARLTVPEEVRATRGKCRWARVIAYVVVSRHGPSCSQAHHPIRGESHLRQVPMGKGDSLCGCQQAWPITQLDSPPWKRCEPPEVSADGQGW